MRVVISRGNRRQGTRNPTPEARAFEFKHPCPEILAVKLRSCTREVCAQDRRAEPSAALPPSMHRVLLTNMLGGLVVVNAVVLGGRVSRQKMTCDMGSIAKRLDQGPSSCT